MVLREKETRGIVSLGCLRMKVWSLLQSMVGPDPLGPEWRLSAGASLMSSGVFTGVEG